MTIEISHDLDPCIDWVPGTTVSLSLKPYEGRHYVTLYSRGIRQLGPNEAGGTAVYECPLGAQWPDWDVASINEYLRLKDTVETVAVTFESIDDARACRDRIEAEIADVEREYAKLGKDAELLKACASYLENRRRQVELGPVRSTELGLDMDGFVLWCSIRDHFSHTTEGADAQKQILALGDWTDTTPKLDEAINETRDHLHCLEQQLALEDVELSAEARQRMDQLEHDVRRLRREFIKKEGPYDGLVF
jgi:hypothetical protein